MWIKLRCNTGQGYMIKIYVGGVNAISGEPAVEDAATRLRRQTKLAAHKAADNKRYHDTKSSPLQDYVVVPGRDGSMA